MIAADAVLSGLTDEQKTAIVTMSQNDENVVIGNKFSEVYNRLDDTILKSTGIVRNGDEKTYNYLERAAKQLAEKANSVDGLNAKVQQLTKERDDLQKAVEKGGDAELRRQLQQANADLNSVREQYNTLKTDYDKMKDGHAAELLGMQIDNALAGAKAGLKFKAEFPQAAIDTLLTQALNNVKGMNPAFIDDGKGGKVLAFMGQDGQPLRNPERQLNPYTAAELLQKELRTMGILDEGRKATGTSTSTTTTTTTSGVIVDVTMAKTQNEADEIIHNQLNAQGLIRGSKAYEEAKTQIWKDNNISSLPMK